jgi:multimeric flavodoxin WrbA
MNIIVLNGSPKGETSATMQHIKYIQKTFPQHHLKIINVSQNLPRIEKNASLFQEILDEVKSSDGVLWAFPLYFFLVHSNYKRFIEMIFDEGAEGVFEHKYTAVLTTSVHVFDHTAHNYMNAICDDLKMNYAGAYSADMHDLLKREERKRLILFAEGFFEAIKKNTVTTTAYPPLAWSDFEYEPADPQEKVDTGGKKVVILTDSSDLESNLGTMVDRFRKSFSAEIPVFNLNDVNMKGACLGCCQCGLDNICAYQGKDDYIDFFNATVKTADILVFAGTVTDRYLSSKWKQFFDRSFFRGHVPSLSNKQMGYIISGPLRQIPNLRQILEGYTGFQQANLVDIVTDEYENSEQIDTLLQNLAGRLVRLSEKGYISPPNFLAIGGTKILRDHIWSGMRFVFQADHAFYKDHGMYDFPHKEYRTRARNAVMMLLTKIPSFKKEFIKRMKSEMIAPHRKILEE